jgi:hypothetical protein
MDYQIKLKYVNWQKDIFEDVNGHEITRGKAISIFVQKGLLPLIYKNGYTLTKNTLQMEDTLASMMFKYSLNKNVIYCVSDINTTEEMREHYDYFCNVPEIILTKRAIDLKLKVGYYWDALNEDNELIWLKNGRRMSELKEQTPCEMFSRDKYSNTLEYLRDDYLKFL